MTIESAFSAELFSVASILTWLSMSVSLPGPWFPSLCDLICMDILEMKVSVVKTADNWPWAHYLPKLKLASKVKVGRALGEIKSKHGPSFVNPSIDNQGRNFILLPITKEGTLPFCWETRKKLSQTEGFLVTPPPPKKKAVPFTLMSKSISGSSSETSWGWRSGSVVRSTCCSCGGQVFASQHPHNGSQSSTSQLPGGSNTLFWLSWAPGINVVYRHACRQNTRIHTIKEINLKKQLPVSYPVTAHLWHVLMIPDTGKAEASGLQAVACKTQCVPLGEWFPPPGRRGKFIVRW